MPLGKWPQGSGGVEQRLGKQWPVGNSHTSVMCGESWAPGQEGGWIGVPISFPWQGSFQAFVWKTLWKNVCCCSVKTKLLSWSFVLLSALKMLSCSPLAEGRLTAVLLFRATFPPFVQVHFSLANLRKTGKPSGTLIQFRRSTTAQAK